MQLLRRLSVRLKISLSFIITFVLLAIFVLIFFPAKQKSQALHAMEDKATSIGNMVAVSIAPGLEFQDEMAVQDAFQIAATDGDVKYLAVYDTRNRLFTSHNYAAPGRGTSFKEGITISGDLLVLSVSVNSAGEKVGKLVMGMSLERINHQITRYRWLIVIVGLMITLLGVFLGWLLGKAITQPLESLWFIADEISERAGDLTTKVPVVSDDEIGKLAKAFNNMIEGLRSMIIKVLDTANDVSDFVKQLSVSSQEISATSQEVSATIQEISSGAAKTAQRVEETSKVMDEMITDVVGILESSQHAVDKINAVSESVGEATNVIAELAAYSEQIGEFVSVISDIANQTNLLALNASIEAARAGEAGRGFTVVAEEVKKLAEDSGEAADKIRHIISDIRKKIDDAVENMQTSSVNVEEGKKVIAGVSSQVEEVLTKGAHRVGEKITEIATMSEDAASATEETSAATEEIASSMEQMNGLITKLYDRATELHELVAEFKVSEK